MKFKQIVFAAAAIAAVSSTSAAHAMVIKGGSELLNSSDADQLTSWIGQGPASLTKIYSKRAGDTSFTFHDEVDGKGATILVVRATDRYTGATGIIGGYNPQSWSSAGWYNQTNNLDDRTAFLFNLTTDQIFRQNKQATSYYWGYSDYSKGSYQTYNWAYYGPTFGGGHDLYIDNAMSYGYSYLYSYSDNAGYYGGNYGKTILGGGYYGYGMSIDALEVFTINESAEVPEPAGIALFGIALFGLAAIRRRRAQ